MKVTHKPAHVLGCWSLAKDADWNMVLSIQGKGFVEA